MDSGLMTVRDRHDRRFWLAAATNNLKPRPKFAVPDGTTGVVVNFQLKQSGIHKEPENSR